MSETINKYLGEEGLRKLIDLTKAYDAASLTLSQEYINEEIAKIKSGNVVVKEAEHADTTDLAANATHAVSADTAIEANHAITADSATNATNAQHAVSANSATEASHAVAADSATKATQDASGNVITETYETKADAQTTKGELTSLINGKADAIHTHDIVTVESNGFMSAEDKVKLDSIDPSSLVKSVNFVVDDDENAVISFSTEAIQSVEGVEF